MDSPVSSSAATSCKDLESALPLIVCALIFLVGTVYFDMARVFLPGRPVSYLILTPVGLLFLASLLVSSDGVTGLSVAESDRFVRAWSRLRWSGLVLVGMSPFFVWQFRLYENRYMLSCGFLAVAALTVYLVQLLRIDAVLSEANSSSWLADVCRWLEVMLPPLTATVALTVYAHAFRYGGRWTAEPVESPYSVWLRLPDWLRWLPVVPLTAVCLLTLVVWLRLKSNSDEEIA